MVKLDLRKNKHGEARFLEKISMTSQDFPKKQAYYNFYKAKKLVRSVFSFIKHKSFSCFKTKINTKHDKKLYLVRNTHTSDYFFLAFLGKIQASHAYFFEKSSLAMLIFSQIQLSHAQSMLIIFMLIKKKHVKYSIIREGSLEWYYTRHFKY